MKSKIFGLMMVGVLAFSLFGAALPARAAGTVGISIQSATAESPLVTAAIGSTFSVLIRIDAGGQPVSGVDTFLNFDPTRLQVIQITPMLSPFDIVLNNTFDNVAGTIDYSAGMLSSSVGSWFVANITFTAIAETPGTSLSFSTTFPRTTMAAYAGDDVTGAITDGTVVIQGAPAVPAANLRVTGNAVVAAGASNQLTVTAYDQYGNVATSYTGHKALTFSGLVASADGNMPTVTDRLGLAVIVGYATTITFTNGVSTEGGILKAYKAEVTTVDVSDGTINSTGNLAWDLDLTVNHAAAANLRVTGTTTPNVGANNELTITACDQYGNVATGYQGAKSLDFSGPAASADGNQPTVEGVNVVGAGTVTVNFISGVSAANAATLVVYKVEVTTLDVTDGTIDSTGDATWDLDLTVGPPAAARTFVVDGITNPIAAGTLSNVRVTAMQSGVIDTSYTGTIHFTSTDPLAVLPPIYTFTSGAGNDNGVHTFVNGVKFGMPGMWTVTATDIVTPAVTGTSVPITVNPGGPGPATTLSVTGITDPIVAGTLSNVTVTAKDQFGNVATGYTGTIVFTSTDPLAVLPANYTFMPPDNGIHTFTGGVIMQTAGEQSVTATDILTPVITGSQTAITVIGAVLPVLDHVMVTPVYPSVAAGANLLFTATAFDQYNNPIPGATFSWSMLIPQAGIINATGLFTAGAIPGAFADAIRAQTTIGAIVRWGTTGVTIVGAAPPPILQEIKEEVDAIEIKIDDLVLPLLQYIKMVVEGITVKIENVMVPLLNSIIGKVDSVQSTLDDETRFTDDAELAALQAQLQAGVDQNERILIEMALLKNDGSSDIVLLWLTKAEKVKAIVWDTIGDLRAAGYTQQLAQAEQKASEGDAFLAQKNYTKAWKSYQQAYKQCATTP